MIYVQSSVIDEDIRKYVCMRLATDLKLNRWRNSAGEDEIETKLMEGANGM
jgi:hypothetical protein